jgi:branched-chain amino acid transport system substrate-binding protein
MLIPGVDFTTIGKVAKAYFDCVNDNGGIKGRPIKYILYNEQLNPAQEAALARKLVESDKVVGIVGNTSFAECGVNWKYYKAKGFLVIGAGVQAECFGTPSIAESNMGPRYSDLGAAQALIRAGVKKIAIASPEAISAYADGGVVKLGQARGVDVKVFPTHLPVTDAKSQLLQMYQFAGNGNGIIIDFTPDTAPAFMNAAIALGIVDKVKWGSSTPIANTFMAKQFPQFDGKLWINQEFSNLDPGVGPDTRLMFAILKKYAPSIAPQAFAQMGFMDGKFVTTALLNVKGPVTAKSYNLAARNLKNVHTDILCKPWYVGNALPYHIPNNTDITVDYKDGKVVVKEKCFDIAPVDKELAQTRIWEKKFNLNTK